MERHYVDRTSWLRAAVLGANDGILSTSSLILGVAAASDGKRALIVAGLAGLVAGATSMAAGEYVSVSSQADSAQADLGRERRELKENPRGERHELAGIYVQRGLEARLADQVAEQLMAKDALEAHARDELGLTDEMRPRPIQAALASAGAFASGAALPLVAAALSPTGVAQAVIAIASLACLGLLGAVGARAGGAPIGRGIVRVLILGALAMAVTTAIGSAVGRAV
ncbi:MAG TPA: VIT family protein [Caulobacteraceae bacterium]|jgi:VIT1/CCC1 family predicted Fe2+/Mn2+ transporter|nr:VIT family protein [Caulobacteraceae bacterium]